MSTSIKILSKSSENLIIFCIALICAITHTQNDILIPSYTDIMRFYNSNPEIMHLQISLNLIAIAVGGPIFGSISDYLGRKNILIVGLIIFIIGCLTCCLSPNINCFLAGRFIQGFGVSAPITITVAIVFDNFKQERAAGIIAFLTGITTLSKGIAPLIGSKLTHSFNWQTNMIFMMIFCFIGLIFILLKFENVKLAKQDFHLKDVLMGYLKILKNKLFLLHLFMLSSMASALSSYVNSISIIFVDSLKISRADFSYFQSSVAITFAASSFLVAYLIKEIGIKKVNNISLILIITSIILMIYTGLINSYYLTNFFSVLVMIMGFSFAIAIFTTSAMSIFPESNGTASAILAFMRLMFISSIIYLNGFFFNHTIKPLNIMLIIISIFVVFINLIISKKRPI